MAQTEFEPETFWLLDLKTEYVALYAVVEIFSTLF